MTGESKATSIKGLLQELTPEAAELLQGVVIQESPLKIQMDNDNKRVVSAVVPRSLTDYEVEIDVQLAAGEIDSETKDNGTHKHELETFKMTGGVLTVHNHLSKGDRVHVLSIQHGKKYYVLDRV